MGVWSPAFQHQFLDGNLLNFSAAPGQEPIISFEAPNVRPTPPAEDRGFPVRRGNRFTYQFASDVFSRVIGVDIKVDVVVPPVGAASQLSGNVTLGNNAIRFLIGFTGGNARLQLFVNHDVVSANAQFDPAAGAALRIHARWHTHGQTQISVNCALRGYHPAIAAGQSFTIEQLAFGHHDTTGFAPAAPAFLLRRVVVKMLRDVDARRALDDLFPLTESSPIDAECRRRFADAQAAILGEIRTFMQQAIARLTSAWQAGMPGGPFTPDGVAAHAAAVATGRAFVEFMLQHPGGDPDLIKLKMSEFLRRIRATDPAACDQAIARLQAMSPPSPWEDKTQRYFRKFVESGEVTCSARVSSAWRASSASPPSPP